MNTFRLLLQKMSWPGLAVLLALLLGLILAAVAGLLTLTEPQSLVALILLGLGVVSVFGGYFATKYVGFELCPQPKQYIGALLVGVAAATMAYSALQMLLLSASAAFIVLPLLISVLFFVEFLTIRISQARAVTTWQLLSLALVAYVTASGLRDLTEGVQMLSGLLLGAGVSALLISRLGHTYLISPWVNSFWNGWAFLAAGFLLVPLTTASGIFSTIYQVSLLPLWLGLMVGLFSLSALVFRQLKHKFRISKGYMQYKLQALTFLLGLMTISLTGFFSLNYLIVFVLIVLAYSIAERRLIINE